jgi:hypothetical protein
MSFGTHAKDNRPMPRMLTFGELIDEFSTPDTSRGKLTAEAYHELDEAVPAEKAIRNAEKDGRYFLASHLSGNGRRCNENVALLCGITLDFDSGSTTAQVIRSRLEGLTYLAYTTYSYRADKQKWRVFVPYPQPISATRHPLVFAHFQQTFQGDVDPHCATPCQFSYTPSCPPDAADLFESFHQLGELFDASTIQNEWKDDRETDPGLCPAEWCSGEA